MISERRHSEWLIFPNSDRLLMFKWIFPISRDIFRLSGLYSCIIAMSEKEEEFPFEEFVEALTESYSLKRSIKHILTAICEKNMYTFPHSATGHILPYPLSSKSLKAEIKSHQSNVVLSNVPLSFYKPVNTPYLSFLNSIWPLFFLKSPTIVVENPNSLCLITSSKYKGHKTLLKLKNAVLSSLNVLLSCSSMGRK